MVLSYLQCHKVLYIVNSETSYQLRQLGQALVLPHSLGPSDHSVGTYAEPDLGVPSEALRAGSDDSLSS